MWWSRAVLALGLAGCGFAPAYGPGGTATALRGAVLAEAPTTDEGYAFVARIEDRLGRADAPSYGLGYTIALNEVALALDASDDIRRFNVEGRLGWTLRRGDAVVLSGEEAAFTGYDAGDSTLSALEARRDAERRLMVILADRVVARLLAAS